MSYGLNLYSQIQQSADKANIGAVYEGIIEAVGPTQKKTVPLKSAIGEIIKYNYNEWSAGLNITQISAPWKPQWLTRPRMLQNACLSW